MKHSKAIIIVWLAILICSLPLGLKAGDLMTYDIAGMSGAETEASQGQEIIDENFSNSLDLSEIAVVVYSSAEELEEISGEGGLADSFNEALAKEYTDADGNQFITASNYGNYSSGDASKEGIVMIAIACTQEGYDVTHQTDEIRDILDSVNTCGLTTYVTGNDAISYDTETASVADVEKVDPLSIALIFVFLGLFFCAVVTAVLPPAVVGMAYGITLTLIYLVASVFDVYYITEILVLVSMLGAGTDYAVFIISRYRDERKRGQSHEEALATAIQWGGESVFTSGLSVIIGFGALALCDFSMVQTMGIVLALGIVVALCAALTFIPSLLNIVGERIYWPSNVEKYKGTEDGTRNGAWSKASRFFGRYFKWLARNTEKYAKPIVAAAIVLAIPCVYVYETTEDSSDMIGIMPGCESVDGLNTIMENTDGGTIMPNYVVIELTSAVYDEGGRGTSFYTYVDSDGDGTPETPVLTSNGYLVWNDEALTLTESGYAGEVVDLMAISESVLAEYGEDGTGFVGTASGLNSWEVIFYKAAETAAESYVVAQLVAAGYTEEQAEAYLATDEGKETVAQAVELIKTSSDYVEQINKAIVGQLPSAVQGSITTFFETAGWAAAPTDAVGVKDPAAGLVAGNIVTVANVLDYGLNVSTGILSDDGNYVNMTIITKDKPMSNDTMDFLETLSDEFHGSDGYDETYSATIAASYISGTSAVMNDMSSVVEDQFSTIRLVVIVLLIVLLFFILGCYLTPIRSMVTIFLSVIIAVAATRLLFGSLLDIPVFWLIPIVLFVVLLGLGMDYDIFLTTRIRENKIKGMDNHEAVRAAVEHAGSVISLCAVIMGGTFLTMTLTGSPMLQEFGFALGFGILFEGLVMVSYVVPALMHLMGEWSWKGPKFLQRKHFPEAAGDAESSDKEERERSPPQTPCPPGRREGFPLRAPGRIP